MKRERSTVLRWTALPMLAGAVGACSADADPTERSDSWFAESRDLSGGYLPPYDEFRERARFRINEQHVFLVEGDIVLWNEAELREYYDTNVTGLQEKAIINANAGVADIRTDSIPGTLPTDITYCVDNSNWGGTEVGDSDGDGINNETIVTKAAVLAGLQGGMRFWEGVANVRFVYQPSNDGAGCAASASDLTVTLNLASHSTATGAFPSAATQQITIPIKGISVTLAQHELGHVLGFRHEHIHSNDTNGCSEGDVLGLDYLELFPNVDTASAMIYAACGLGPDGIPGNTDDFTIAGNPVSPLDGVGARQYYKNPDWWAGL